MAADWRCQALWFLLNGKQTAQDTTTGIPDFFPLLIDCAITNSAELGRFVSRGGTRGRLAGSFSAWLNGRLPKSTCLTD
jgi:hypothetical protein